MFVSLSVITVSKNSLLMHHYPKYLLILFLCLAAFTIRAQTAKKYIQKYENLAVEKMLQHEIPASIILGVSLVESAAGQSIVCKAFNNFFGVKGKNKDSKKKIGYKSAYKEYASDKASFEHFCEIVKKKKFYKKLKGSGDFKEWLRQMDKASYANARGKWIRKISATILKFKLYE